MSIFFLFIFSCLSLYALVLLWLAAGFRNTKVFDPKLKFEPVPLTVIICARNEHQRIGNCLRSIATQTYPKDMVEIILVDDHSTDNTVQAADTILSAAGIVYRIIRNEQRLGKKRSIAKAMVFATNPLIVLRDADTSTHSNKWLKSISDFYVFTRADLIIAPLVFTGSKGFLWALQVIENKILTLLTVGSAYYKKPFLCNGANLIFKKAIFEKVSGFKSHVHIESGDDVLFLEDVKKVPGAQIAYLKNDDAVVETLAVQSIGSLVEQRTRWASKFKYNANKLNLLIAILTFIVNGTWLFCFAKAFQQGEFYFQCLLFIVFKLLIDFLLLFLSTGFSRKDRLLGYLIPVSLFYPVYAITVALSSLFSKPRWQ